MEDGSSCAGMAVGFFVTCCSEKLHLCALCICAYVRELALSALDEPEWINGAARRRVNGENPSHFFWLLFGGKKRFHRIVQFQPRRLHENVLEERKEKEEEKKTIRERDIRTHAEAASVDSGS